MSGADVPSSVSVTDTGGNNNNSTNSTTDAATNRPSLRHAATVTPPSTAASSVPAATPILPRFLSHTAGSARRWASSLRQSSHSASGHPLTGSGARQPLYSQSERRLNYGSADDGTGRKGDGAPSWMSSQQLQQQQAAAAAVAAQLTEQQQSATRSAISMNHLFNEARRELRRTARPEYEAASTDENGIMGTEIGADGEAAGHHHHHHHMRATAAKVKHVLASLSWRTDLANFYQRLWDNRILSMLLLCIPFGIISGATGFGGSEGMFLFNFCAIIPLAWLMGDATEELALRSNQTIGSLLNATFGNMTELIVSVIALDKGMIKLVQTSLLGSILSNCLLVLGCSFFLGGLKNKVQVYNHKGAHMLSTLLLLASIALVLPAAFVNSFTPHPHMKQLLRISRATAAIMFIIYILYLFFQLYTHSEMFSDENEEEDEEEGAPVRNSRSESPPASVRMPRRNQSSEPYDATRMNGHVTSVGANGLSYGLRDMESGESYFQGGVSSSPPLVPHHNDDSSGEEDDLDARPIRDHMSELADLSEERSIASSSSASSRSARSNNGLSHAGSERSGRSAGSGSGSGSGSGRSRGSGRSGSVKSVIGNSQQGSSRSLGMPSTNGLDVENQSVDSEDEDDDDDDECGGDEPQFTFLFALTLLCLDTILVAVCSDYLVDSIKDVTEAWNMNESFVGIILIPIVGNAAEHATAVTVAMRNKMDLSIGVAIGSSTQIALFLIPFITLLGWIIHQPMNLNFSSFETIVLVMAVLMVNFLLHNGESNWLQGVMLMAVYLIIAATFYYHPGGQSDFPHHSQVYADGHGQLAS